MRRPRINGRRGVFLTIFGGIYVAIGMSYIYPPDDAPVHLAMSWLPVPLWVVGVIWTAAGLTACVAAFMQIPRDRFGFEALSGVAAGWMVAQLISWTLGLAPRGWVGALLMALIGAAVLTVSGMLNPPKGQLP